MRKIGIIVIILLLILTGCSNKTEIEKPIIDEVVDVETPVDVEPVVEINPIIEEFDGMLPFIKANEIGKFIDENIKLVDKVDAEYMIEMLVIYQSELINDMNMKIYNDDYMNALNIDMGGVINPDLIKNIENETIRKEFQILIDAKLKTVRYEENPVVETDWEEIKKYSEYFTDDFVRMIELNDMIQNHIFDYYYLDHETLVKDAVETEELILSTEKSFLSWQLELIYSKQMSYLLVGPEGEYIGAFITKDGLIYDKIIGYSEIYKGTHLGDLIDELVNIETDDFSVVGKIITENNILGLKSDKKAISKLLTVGDNDVFYMTLIEVLNDTELEEKINKTIETQVYNIIGDSEGQRLIFTMPVYGTDEYLSLIISFISISAEYGYESKIIFLTVDLETGEKVTLDEFFGLPFEEYKTYIEELKGITISEMPEFAMDNSGVNLLVLNEELGYEEYIMLSINEIIRYVDYSVFYK